MELKNGILFPIYDVGIISRDHAIKYIELVSKINLLSSGKNKLKKHLFYDDDPKLWVRNMMFFNPHFLNHIVIYWLINIPSKEILEDFRKCLGYYVFVALENIVGKKLYPYTNKDVYGNLFGYGVDNFTSRDGLDLYTRLLFFGMEEYKIENDNLLLMVRDCKDFIEGINNYKSKLI